MNKINPFLLLFSSIILISISSLKSTATIAHQLIKGFTTTPDPTVTYFQPILYDPTNNFSLSFLRVNHDQLVLAVVHVSSGVPIWQPGPTAQLAHWGKPTKLIFNGSLVFMDSSSGVFWSTNTIGDNVILTTSSNLQIHRQNSILWQSFEFPFDTLVENQNFTSTMQLVSSNGLYMMRLGPDYIGLYAKFKNSGSGQIYLKHRALQAKVDIIKGKGPIMVRVSSDGFLGMYQNGSVPADIQSFNSYERFVPGPRRVRLEEDGNLKGYYWSGSGWVLDYQAIPDMCELPSPCGPYGLCRPEGGCSCLDNQTQSELGKCYPRLPESGDLCGDKLKLGKYRVIRRTRVELPFKELMGYTKMESYDECEKSCEMNCTCWGVLYNNASGFCYNVDYPIETILGVGDETKMGYFKVWEGAKKKSGVGLGVGIGLLCGGVIGILGLLIFGFYKLRRKNRSDNRFLEEEDIVNPGPYKDLGSQSFGSVELSNR